MDLPRQFGVLPLNILDYNAHSTFPYYKILQHQRTNTSYTIISLRPRDEVTIVILQNGGWHVIDKMWVVFCFAVNYNRRIQKRKRYQLESHEQEAAVRKYRI